MSVLFSLEPNAQYKVIFIKLSNAEHRAQSTEHRAQSTEHKIMSLEVGFLLCNFYITNQTSDKISVTINTAISAAFIFLLKPVSSLIKHSQIVSEILPNNNVSISRRLSKLLN
ncbi:hypothetical protein MAH4_30260 [Sessilibacter sp. MAH4]